MLSILAIKHLRFALIKLSGTTQFNLVRIPAILIYSSMICTYAADDLLDPDEIGAAHKSAATEGLLDPSLITDKMKAKGIRLKVRSKQKTYRLRWLWLLLKGLSQPSKVSMALAMPVFCMNH